MRKSKNQRQKPTGPFGLSEITIEGFKSIRDETCLEIRPLTLLAGANSTGKSSFMQPLLLLKQTLDDPSDPGPLLLKGPNVQFDFFDQLLWREPSGERVKRFSVKVRERLGFWAKAVYSKGNEQPFAIEETSFIERGQETCLRPDTVPEGWRIERVRCFLYKRKETNGEDSPGLYRIGPDDGFVANLRELIHVPALRGNQQRTYPVRGLGPAFPGPFSHYLASILVHWQQQYSERVEELCTQLAELGLTDRVEAKQLNDAEVVILVGRLPCARRGQESDLINIADVGFGVSQALPVVVALLAPQPNSGQLVYIEQPEIHLHPKAQIAMAGLLAAAARRGARLVVETHSALLLLGVQTLVAKGDLDPDLVKLHWFKRDKGGATHVHTGDLDEQGRFGDWPKDSTYDFASVELSEHRKYLDAARL